MAASSANVYEDFHSVDLMEDESVGLSGVDTDLGDNRSQGLENDVDIIASKLLQENLVLTALELHCELTENGRELTLLRDYFSNPVNFEHLLIKPVTSSHSDGFQQLSRSNSVQTFESLDFSRHSDDTERQHDEKIAVLEFELRKAKETIKSLRSQITTDATTTHSDTVVKDDGQIVAASTLAVTCSEIWNEGNSSPMKEHEKRALNFLVNEFLLHRCFHD
jgi:hypothetical protein